MDKIISFFTTLTLIFQYIFGLSTISCSDNVTLTAENQIIGIEALSCAQGLCTDGEYYYTSGAVTAIGLTGLTKYDLNFKKVKTVSNPIPKEFRDKYDSNHIGGIDYYNGKIYCAVEDDGYETPLVLLYDCETLEYTGEYYEFDASVLTDGIPWCAIDRENGYLYTSKFKGVKEILRFNLNDMSDAGSIILSEEINRIQGGSVYDGTLYLSYDVSNSTDEQIFAVDIQTGEVTVAFERYLDNYDNEAEDICVYPMPDGTLFHTQDYDKLIAVNFRHYAYKNEA